MKKRKREKQRTTVSIYGQQYNVVGYETPEHVKAVADELDTRMKEYKRLNPYLDTTRLAVLTAVNVLDENKKLREQVEFLERQRLTGDEKNA